MFWAMIVRWKENTLAPNYHLLKPQGFEEPKFSMDTEYASYFCIAVTKMSDRNNLN